MSRIVISMVNVRQEAGEASNGAMRTYRDPSHLESVTPVQAARTQLEQPREREQ